MRTITRLLLSLLFTGLFLSLATPALAARSYLIELVIFTTQGVGDTEKWTVAYPPLNTKKMSRAIIPGQGALEMEDELNEIKESSFPFYVDRISKNPGKRVILSTHWVQPVLDQKNTIIARITDHENTVDDLKDVKSNNVSSITGGQFPVEQPLLDGFINFYVDSQYTLEADIRYTPPYRPSILDEEPDIGPVSYRIYEKRRMKSGELNYYDHPEFGMVLLVTPVETPPEQATENN